MQTNTHNPRRRHTTRVVTLIIVCSLLITVGGPGMRTVTDTTATAVEHTLDSVGLESAAESINALATDLRDFIDPDAAAHTSGGHVTLYPPVRGTSNLDRFNVADPVNHHCVYGAYGYQSDICFDHYGTRGARVVTPFGYRTSEGDIITQRITAIRPACRSGRLADGGSMVEIEARNSRTGERMGKAQLAHIDNVQVRVGDRIGGWTVLGYLKQYRYNSCYQVTNPAGTHLHVELTAHHRYSCTHWNIEGRPISETTPIGKMGDHRYTQRRAAC